MSYATVFSSHIVLGGVPECDWPALEAMTDWLFIHASPGETPEGLAAEFLAFDTPWKIGTGFNGKSEVVEFCDIRIEPDGSRLLLVGTEYRGGTRRHQLRQINWLLAWLKARYPAATFAGELFEHDAETDSGNVWVYVVDGDRAYLHATELIVGERLPDDE